MNKTIQEERNILFPQFKDGWTKNPNEIAVHGIDYDCAGGFEKLAKEDGCAIVYAYSGIWEAYVSLQRVGESKNLPPEKEYQSNLEMCAQVMQLWDKHFNFIRIDFECGWRELKTSLGKLDGTNNIVELLRNLEAQGKICIVHLPDYYTNEIAMKDKCRTKFTSREELDAFLASPERCAKVSPLVVLQRAANLDEESILNLLSRFKASAQLCQLPNLFGEGSFTQNLSPESKARVLDRAIAQLEAKTKKAMTAYMSGNRSFLDWEDVLVNEKCGVIRDAMQKGIILPNYTERLKKLADATHYYPGLHSGRVIRQQREEISELELLLDQLSGKPDNIKGAGLEFVSVGTSDSRAYLDGELIGCLTNAEFSDTPTNGTIVSWIVRDVIDRNNVTGIQWQDTVFAWKKGMQTPSRIHQNHAWTIENIPRLSSPVVKKDGTIMADQDGNELVFQL